MESDIGRNGSRDIEKLRTARAKKTKWWKLYQKEQREKFVEEMGQELARREGRTWEFISIKIERKGREKRESC